MSLWLTVCFCSEYRFPMKKNIKRRSIKMGWPILPTPSCTSHSLFQLFCLMYVVPCAFFRALSSLRGVWPSTRDIIFMVLSRHSFLFLGTAIISHEVQWRYGSRWTRPVPFRPTMQTYFMCPRGDNLLILRPGLYSLRWGNLLRSDCSDQCLLKFSWKFNFFKDLNTRLDPIFLMDTFR